MIIDCMQLRDMSISRGHVSVYISPHIGRYIDRKGRRGAWNCSLQRGEYKGRKTVGRRERKSGRCILCMI